MLFKAFIIAFQAGKTVCIVALIVNGSDLSLDDLFPALPTESDSHFYSAMSILTFYTMFLMMLPIVLLEPQFSKRVLRWLSFLVNSPRLNPMKTEASPT